MRGKIIKLVEDSGHKLTSEVSAVIDELSEIIDAEGDDDIKHVLEWLQSKRDSTDIKVSEIGIKDLDNWNVDPNTGNISHDSGRFFQVVGIKMEGALDREVDSWTQPIMKQEECGILGIIRKNIDGIRHYLLWAKYEPGSIEKHQLSPCLQATLSNLDRVHGGKKPLFAEYFEPGSKKAKIISSVEHVEDPGRFYLKTNRCIVVEIGDDELPSIPEDFIWLTLPQIKKLMKIDRIVNSFTRAIFGNL